VLQVDILRDTVMGALNAALPIGTQRTIYLCDDLPGEGQGRRLWNRQPSCVGAGPCWGGEGKGGKGCAVIGHLGQWCR